MFVGCTRDLTEHTDKVKTYLEKSILGMKPYHPMQLPNVSHKKVKPYQIFLKR